MKKRVKCLIVIFSLALIVSCKKDKISVSCFECSTETESIEVCEEDGDFLVDGETVENPNNASLEDYVDAIEDNPNNDPALEGIRCRRK